MAKVFKKNSGNGLICLYLATRDFVDHVNHVDVVDGVLKVDPSGLDERKVWVQLACTFRYGRDDLDVIGLSFRKDIWKQLIQIYPPPDENNHVTPMQEALLKKAGEGGHPFTFTIPTNLPCSVTLQPAPGDKGKACGVDFEVKAYIAQDADNPNEKISKRDTCRLVIRKIQFAPDKMQAGPKVEVCKHFLMSDKTIYLEALMEKEVYHHGDPIRIKVKITNNTNKVVRKINISIEQTTDVVLYSADKYTKVVLCEDFPEHVDGCSTFKNEYDVTPLLANNKEKRGLALDGWLKDEDTNLASSTILRDGTEKEVQGILVSYKIKVNLVMAGGKFLSSLTSSYVTAELPLVLMSQKPIEQTSNLSEFRDGLKIANRNSSFKK